MKLKQLCLAALLGMSVSLIHTTSTVAQSKSIVKVTSQQTSESIVVPLNRAIVLESEQAFAELSVANPGIADIATLSDRSIYVLGKTPGRTTLTLLGADGRLITNVNVVVNPDLAEFKELVNEIMPGEKVEIRAANDGIVISGVASGTQTLARIVELAERYAPGRVSNLATVGGAHQVMLKVRFAEMTRSVAKGLGSSLAGGNGSTAFGSGSYVGASTLGTVLANALNPIANADATGVIGGTINVGNFAVDVLIDAMETKGLVRTLAEPNLVTLSGNEAAFLAGGEYPIPVASETSGGASTVTVEFKPFGVEMKFLPTVLDNGSINLQLQTAVSEIDPTNSFTTDVISIPAFTRREAATVVEMKDGQSIAIAGLLKDDFTDFASQMPWLGDVPVLGTLFRSANYQREQSELVIIVTAHLVTPVDGDVLALPTDRIRLPSESDLFLTGRVTGKSDQKTSNGTVATQDFKGSYGYVLE
ncbi:general secretion pathway protein [Amylibacter marinus]|uniref:General secretion pathway protein n=1 Tax=Amylibacter marinus TaxID=1475483 RepID=A0ABQ5VQX5_9RHOB|nr:type II and III secretion system protein family protein [Amylibacter marinus]GLQ33796.1 general secretion pathway protein [Amylibacter marinus]